MLKMYFKLKSQYLKTAMEYVANFWMMFISGVVMRTLMIGGVYVIYQNINSIAGFKKEEIYMIMGFIFLTEGLCNIFFDGIWHLSSLVFNGEFDTMLIKPISPFFQVLSYEVGLQGIGTVPISLVILFYSMYSLGILNLTNILFVVLFSITGTIFRLSTYIISATTVFYLGSTPTDPMFVISSFGENAKYPVSIFPRWMKIILMLIIPFGFIGYIPTLIFRGNTSTLILIIITILFSLVFFLISRYIFNKGIKKYESMGM